MVRNTKGGNKAKKVASKNVVHKKAITYVNPDSYPKQFYALLVKECGDCKFEYEMIGENEDGYTFTGKCALLKAQKKKIWLKGAKNVLILCILEECHAGVVSESAKSVTGAKARIIANYDDDEVRHLIKIKHIPRNWNKGKLAGSEKVDERGFEFVKEIDIDSSIDFCGARAGAGDEDIGDFDIDDI